MKTINPIENEAGATDPNGDEIAVIVSALKKNLKTAATVEADRGVELTSRMRQLSSSSVLVFDFDGTIGDTEKIHLAAYNLLLKKEGINLSEEQFGKYRGNTEFDIYDLIERDFGTRLPKESFRSERLAIFLDLADRVGLTPFGYVSRTMGQAADTGALSIVVSSQLGSVVARLLAKWQLVDHLAGIFVSDLFGRRKIELLDSLPHRYLRDANNFVVFEDSPFVVTHARTLGMAAHLVTS